MIVRPPAEDDFDEVLALLQATDEADVGEVEWGAGELREDWDRCEDAWVVEVDGRVAAYATLEDRGGGRLVADGYVHPELRGRGLGTELLRVTEQRARSVRGEDEPAYLQNAAVHDACTAKLSESHGYVPVRHFFRMLIEHDHEPEPAVVPDDVDIRPYRHPEEARALYEAVEDAFADHWQHHRRSFEEWSRRRLERPDFDPTLCWVAVAGDELAGAAMCDWKHEGDWGWVGILGVRGDYRRRGIAEALLRTAFVEFWRRGEHRVALGVDAQNPTGATRLYEHVGMRVLWTAVVYEKELRCD